MIKIGRLTEEFDCMNKYGKAEYRYYYNPPKVEPEVKQTEVKQVEQVEQVEPEPERTENRTIVSIYHGETTVAIEGIGGDDLVAVIKAITN